MKEALNLGTLYLSRRDSNYNDRNYTLHTFELVVDTLHSLEKAKPTANLLLPFIHIICFDAWIANTDRHQENWGIISSLESDNLRLAPLYDPAACLGAELQDHHSLLLQTADYELRVKRYIANCKSGFGDNTQLMLMSQLVEEARLTDIWQSHVENWLSTFSSMMIQIRSYIEGLPVEWLPLPRKELAITLLERRLAWLQERR